MVQVFGALDCRGKGLFMKSYIIPSLRMICTESVSKKTEPSTDDIATVDQNYCVRGTYPPVVRSGTIRK